MAAGLYLSGHKVGWGLQSPNPNFSWPESYIILSYNLAWFIVCS